VSAVLVIGSRGGWISLTPPPKVQIAIAHIEVGQSADALVIATGYLESRRQANIGAKAPGRIEAIHVEEGTRVKKGEVLAVLEHADLAAALAAANATLERTKAELAEHEVQIKQYARDFQRVEQLRASRSISEDEYDDAKYAYDMALVRRDMLKAAVALVQARANEAREHKENMFVRAPFDGTVISKDAEVGESIMPGGMGEASGRGSVVTIADLDHLEVETDVKEDYISRTRVGQPAEIAVDAVPDQRYKGRVRKIIPMGDRARATIKVKVEILDADERLFPEMSATVYFLPDIKDSASHEADRKMVFCPSVAVQADANGSFVWVVDDEDKTRRVAVTAGEVRDGRRMIEHGLAGGERVVIESSADLKPGQAVRIVE
jgi:RND family efflux transporter MFP subunit